MLFVIVSIYKPIVHHMDVKTNFLIGELEKKKNIYIYIYTYYMEQPEGCVVLGQ